MKTRRRVIFPILLTLILIISGVSFAAATPKIKSTSIKMNISRITLTIGDIATLTGIMKPANSTDKLTWSSADKSIATINSYGVVTAKAEGTTTISVKTSSRKTASCTITVKQVLSKQETEELIASSIADDETISKLIKENSLSEDDVKKLIADSKPNTDNWTDGATLSLISTQKYPMLVSDPDRTGITGNITAMTVTKRRMTSNIISGNSTIYLPYKYDVILNANVPVISDVQKSSYYAGIKLGAANAASDIGEVYEITHFSYAGNTLTEMISIYSAYDISEFFVEKAVWEHK